MNTSSRDVAADLPSSDGGSPSCSATLTEDACNLLAGCHLVFVEGNQCACATPGCCMLFNRCAQGAQADCKGPATCKIMAPTCGTGFAVAYEGTCYEGCVRSATCEPS